MRRIDATMEEKEVYEATRKAIIPQLVFIIGPKACGKTAIAKNMEARTNMWHVDFT